VSRRGQALGRPFRGGGVGDLDPHQARRLVEEEPETEVGPLDTTVLYGVRGEFADDEGDRARQVRNRRKPPLLHAPHGKAAGEARTPGRRGELRCERRVFGGLDVAPIDRSCGSSSTRQYRGVRSAVTP